MHYYLQATYPRTNRDFGNIAYIPVSVWTPFRSPQIQCYLQAGHLKTDKSQKSKLLLDNWTVNVFRL